MLIKNEQQDVFKENALKKFEDEMLEHLANFSPPLYEVLGEDQMRIVIRLGINQAGKHGFNFRGPVRLYLEMMLLLGSFFNTDPQYTWAAEILKNSDAPQMQRAEQLYKEVCDYRKKVGGEDEKYTFDALRAIAIYAKKQSIISANDFVSMVQRDITLIYPQKAEYAGTEAIRLLVNRSVIAAKKYGIATDRGSLLAVVLMLAFGHGCFEDPLYPWIYESINNDRVADIHSRIKRLERKALVWLEHILDNRDKQTEDGLL